MFVMHEAIEAVAIACDAAFKDNRLAFAFLSGANFSSPYGSILPKVFSVALIYCNLTFMIFDSFILIAKSV